MGQPFALQIEEDSRTPLFLRIARAIARDIERGRLRPGVMLPGTRSLAADLAVNRNTVVAAYHELALQGWIEPQQARGAVVARNLPAAGDSVALRQRPASGGARPDTGSLAADRSPAPLVFSDGTPDPRLVPRVELARAFRRALASPAFLGPAGYGDPRGSLRLRVALAQWLASTRGLAIGPGDILLTRGSQMALFLAAHALAAPGFTIAVEDPGYPLAWAAFRAAGARVAGIPVDREGISIEALQDLGRSDRSIRAVLVTPHHQYPTTTTLGAGRRLALLRLAAEYGWVVIEDDYDHEYRYEGRPVLPLAAADAGGAGGPVIYVGSLSKMLAPGLRLGYVVAAPALLDAMCTERETIDRQGDIPLEQAVAELIEDGELARHARKARKIYQQRRDNLVEELRRELPEALSFVVPAGGLALWARVADGLDASHWASRARKQGLTVSPSARFSLRHEHPNAFRLGFAAFDNNEIKTAVRRLVASIPTRTHCSGR